jgi:hypothetical protein
VALRGVELAVLESLFVLNISNIRALQYFLLIYFFYYAGLQWNTSNRRKGENNLGQI